MSGHSKWANIKHKKDKMDAQRGKMFTKLGRQITIAAREGGGDPNANFRLRIAIDKAKEVNMPNDNIQRCIQRGVGGGEGGNYEEIVYEGYGPAGVAVLVEAATDNRNRTAGEMRYIFSRNGGNLGESGCVSWMFDKKGYLVIEKEGMEIDLDELMLLALDAGADDVKENEDSIEIYTSSDVLQDVKESLEGNGVKFSVAENTMLPQTVVNLTGDDAKRMIKLMDTLEEHDDVQDVYANFEIDDAEMENM